MRNRGDNDMPDMINDMPDIPLERMTQFVERGTLNNLRQTCSRARFFVDYVRQQVAFKLSELNELSREEKARYLRHFIPLKSEIFASLHNEAANIPPNPYIYALYALVANVNVLNRFYLQMTINQLTADGCFADIISSLKIIDCYLASQSPGMSEQQRQFVLTQMRAAITSRGEAHINLRGAHLHCGLLFMDLSHADFRHTNFWVDARGSNLNGVNFEGARFCQATLLHNTRTEGVNITDVDLGNMHVEFEAEMETPGCIIFDENVPQLIRDVFMNELHRRSNQGGCTIA